MLFSTLQKLNLFTKISKNKVHAINCLINKPRGTAGNLAKNSIGILYIKFYYQNMCHLWDFAKEGFVLCKNISTIKATVIHRDCIFIITYYALSELDCYIIFTFVVGILIVKYCSWKLMGL